MELECVAGTVYLRGVSFTSSTDVNPYWTLLSQEEKDRALRFKFLFLQQRYIFFRGVLRQTLAGFLDVAPQSLTIAVTEYGKPYLVDYPALQFNISHTEDEAIIAVTANVEIGVDIETVKSLEFDELTQRFFSAGEYDYFRALTEEEKLHAFFQLWTGKEAFIKATGLGLSQNLKTFTLNIEPLRLLTAENTSPSAWTFQAFTWKNIYPCAFATKQVVQQVQWLSAI